MIGKEAVGRVGERDAVRLVLARGRGGRGLGGACACSTGEAAGADMQGIMFAKGKKGGKKKGKRPSAWLQGKGVVMMVCCARLMR